jgi:FlaA1/EpsC-like NDP-sugar epimerase
MSNQIDGSRILITGGTGSLGQHLTKRLLADFKPKSITIFSRTETKRSNMIANFSDNRIRYISGDVADFVKMVMALRGIDIVIHTAAMKRIEDCEAHPLEADDTNVGGAKNIIRAIKTYDLPVHTVLGISTDKACDPFCLYGQTKLAQEQQFTLANDDVAGTRFMSTRYGNVIGSTGSVIPIWQGQMAKGQPITVTDPIMTRFLISLDQAVDTVLDTIEYGDPGDIFIPKLPAAYIGDMAKIFDCSNVKLIGRKPMEKTHEVLITRVESERTVEKYGYYIITREDKTDPALAGEYSSRDNLISLSELTELFGSCGIIKEVVKAA